MVECPRCSADFGGENALANHIWKSGDDPHRDVDSLTEAYDLIDDTGGNSEQEAMGDPSETTLEEDGLGLPGRSSDPSDLEDAEKEDEDVTVDPPEASCPSCGTDAGIRVDEVEPDAYYECEDCEAILPGAAVIRHA